MATLKRTLPGGILDVLKCDMVSFKEASSQTFKAGDPLDLTSGKATIVVAYGNALGANDDIMGFAAEDASGTEDTMIKVYLIDKPTRVRLPVRHGTPSSAVTADTQNGTAYGLYLTSDGILCVEIDDTSDVKGKVCGIPTYPYPIGEQYGLVS